MDSVTRPQARVLIAILLVVFAGLITAGTNTAAQQTASTKYRADVVPSAVAGGRAAALEELLNTRATEGYEIFDIDRDAAGNTLVVFELAK